MANVYIETYGCALAQFDSLTMEYVLRRRGHGIVGSPEYADVIVVNTCSVRLDTEQRIVKRLRELQRLFPGKRLVVAGCLAKSRPGLIARVTPNASLVSPQNASKVWAAVESGSRVILLEGDRDTSWMPRIPVVDAVGTIMIQEGCLGDCSFCITKLARRAVKSYPPRLVVEAVRDLVRRGAKEIRLTGQDTGAYGVDLPGKPSLADLLNAILEKVPGDYRIRVGMMTPEAALEIIDDMLEAYSDSRVYKFFHIPVQSGDDEILKLMSRGYTVDEYKSLISKIRSRYPESMIATDIIVGHPGETEESFQRTMRLIEELRFERVHIAQYTIRPRTKAAGMPQVPDPVKKERSKRLTALVERIGLEIHSKYVGRKLDALVTERGFRPGSLVARLNNYIPVIIPYDKELLGKWVTIEVLEASFYDLRGRVANARG